jgi:sugar lactone lactonase YvrE
LVELYEEPFNFADSDSDEDESVDEFFSCPDSVAVGPDGILYVADSRKHCIKMIKDGAVTVFAGQEHWAGCVDGDKELQARFNRPVAVAVGPDNTVYVSDQANSRIRTIKNGIVSTLVGSSVGYENGSLLQSKFSHPHGICIGPDSTIYVADHGNHAIRAIKNGVVSTLQEDISCSFAVAVGPDGAVYVAQKCVDKISVIKNGLCKPLAGGSLGEGFTDGPSDQSRFNSPSGLVVAPDNTVYVSDHGNCCIRTIRDGMVRTLYKYADRNWGDSGYAGVAFGPDNSLYVSESHNHRVFQLTGLPVMDILDIRAGVNIGARKEISLSGTAVHIHEHFMKIRCPKLLENNSSAPQYSADIVRMFVDFLYSDKLHLSNLEPLKVLQLASVLHHFGFYNESISCLNRLQFLGEEQEALSVADLVMFYCECLDWKNFDMGRQTCAYLLAHHHTKVNSRSLPDIMKSHRDRTMDLLHDLLENSKETSLSLQVPENVSKKVKTSTLKYSLSKLLDSKSGADFDIHINREASIKCHSFVLYARWPYFRQMIDSNMKEAREKKLTLPNIEEDGGMHPVVLKALLAVCYTGELSPALQKEIDPIMACRILGECALYLAGFDVAESSATTLLNQVAKTKMVAGVDLENCVVLYERASELGIEELVTSSKKFISENIASLKFREESVRQLTRLPWHLQAFVLWQQLGIVDPSTIVGPPSTPSSSAAFADDDADNEPPKKRRKTNSKAASGTTRTTKGR